MRSLRGRSRSSPAGWRGRRSRWCSPPGHSIPPHTQAAALAVEPTVELLCPVAPTEAAVEALVAVRLSDEPHGPFVRACIEATGGNLFLIEEPLGEVAACRMDPTAPAAAGVPTIVPHGGANAVLIRLARPTQIPGVHGISDVSHPSTTLCVATANGGELLVSTDPTGGPNAWSVDAVDGTNNLTAVSCPTTTECFASLDGITGGR